MSGDEKDSILADIDASTRAGKEFNRLSEVAE